METKLTAGVEHSEFGWRVIITDLISGDNAKTPMKSKAEAIRKAKDHSKHYKSEYLGLIEYVNGSQKTLKP